MYYSFIISPGVWVRSFYWYNFERILLKKKKNWEDIVADAVIRARKC